MAKPGTTNVKMIITEEKVLANIERIQKLINPKSKKQIVQFDEDTAFKDLVQSVKSYLVEYPNKNNFPSNVYNASFELVEFTTKQFEETTKKIEDLIVQREQNIATASKLRKTLEIVQKKADGWEEKIQKISEDYSQDIIETLGVIGRTKSNKSDNYQEATKTIESKISNLESNMFIEIDMERLEDRSKALSYIGIEIADALKEIPAPLPQNKQEVQEMIKQNSEVQEQETENEQYLNDQYLEETRIEVKPTLWQRFKNTKLIRAIRYMMKIKIVLEFPALPEGNEEEKDKE